jgi:tRNA pseudouridine55 synthase
MDRLFTAGQRISHEDLKLGGCFLVDKPLEWTSFDVVNKLRYHIRRKLGLKKYKIGHAGTLDPLASGLLLICFSHYTKKIEELMGHSKSYSATFRLWATTPCYDAELPIDTYYPQRSISEKSIHEAGASFLGETKQYPPVFSALKLNGVPMYKLARDGKAPEMNSRTINISQLEITKIDLPFIDLEIDCSKGTYIRSIAYDMGQKLNNGAYLSALRRTKIGAYSVDNAWTVSDLCQCIDAIVES